jgi:UDP:flavonoid glycosyltransferase YjiC (YdhE family)
LQDDVPLAEAALGAVAQHPVRALLTVGPDHEPSELSMAPANARVEKTVPHSAVLAQDAFLLSHAGHGSVMKALWFGRPMVLVPWGRDQPGVADRAAGLGVAEVVARNDATEETLSAALGRVLGNQEMLRIASEHSERLRATDPPAVAASLLETLL